MCNLKYKTTEYKITKYPIYKKNQIHIILNINKPLSSSFSRISPICRPVSGPSRGLQRGLPGLRCLLDL